MKDVVMHTYDTINTWIGTNREHVNVQLYIHGGNM